MARPVSRPSTLHGGLKWHLSADANFSGSRARTQRVAGLVASGAIKLAANPLGLPIGSQVWPHRAMLKDFPAFVKKMAEIGVTRLELCSPIGYGDEFASLANGKEVEEDPGRSRHEGRELALQHGRAARRASEKSIEWAKDVGITQMITATLGEGNGGDHPTLDQVKKAADEYNKIAAVAAKAGIQQGLHNEGFELVDGRRQADLRPAVRPARSEAGQVPVPDVDDHRRPRRRRLLPEVPRPLLLDAPPGRRHERAGPAAPRCRQRRRCDARRWRSARAASTG